MENKYPIEEKLNELIETVQNDVLILESTPVRGVPHDPNPIITELRAEILAHSTQQGHIWVNASERKPDSWHLKCARFIHTKQPIIDPKTFIERNPKAIDVIEWLDESSIPSKESDAVAFMNWTLQGDCMYWATDEDQWTHTETGENITTEQLYELFLKQKEVKP